MWPLVHICIMPPKVDASQRLAPGPLGSVGLRSLCDRHTYIAKSKGMQREEERKEGVRYLYHAIKYGFKSQSDCHTSRHLFTLVYTCSHLYVIDSLYTRVKTCTHLCMSLYTFVYTCIILYTLVYPCKILLNTCICMYTPLYTCIPLDTLVYTCVSMLRAKDYVMMTWQHLVAATS